MRRAKIALSLFIGFSCNLIQAQSDEHQIALDKSEFIKTYNSDKKNDPFSLPIEQSEKIFGKMESEGFQNTKGQPGYNLAGFVLCNESGVAGKPGVKIRSCFITNKKPDFMACGGYTHNSRIRDANTRDSGTRFNQ